MGTTMTQPTQTAASEAPRYEWSDHFENYPTVCDELKDNLRESRWSARDATNWDFASPVQPKLARELIEQMESRVVLLAGSRRRQDRLVSEDANANSSTREAPMSPTSSNLGRTSGYAVSRWAKDEDERDAQMGLYDNSLYSL